MQLPDALERQLRQEGLDRLPAVPVVGEDVVQIEQDAAVGGLDHPRHELSVGQLVRPRAEVIHAGLDRQGHRQCGRELADGGAGRANARERLTRRQEEPGRAVRRSIEAQVLAEPGRLEPLDDVAQQRHLRGLGPHRAAHRGGHAVDQLAPGEREAVPEHLLVGPVTIA
jgi:hypothetical protein